MDSTGVAGQGAVAAAIVITTKGVLIGRRSDGNPLWTFPSGRIQTGESPEDAELMGDMSEAVRRYLIRNLDV